MTTDAVVLDRFDRSVDGFIAMLGQVQPDQWHHATPCSEWDVRALVNHVCSEQRWMPPLLRGATIAEMGDALSGDLLGADPLEAFTLAADQARDALTEMADLNTMVALSYGPTPARRYCVEVGLDTLVHTWDLARGIGARDDLPADLVAAALVAVEPWVQPQGIPGIFAAPIQVDEDVDDQTRLLAMLGRRR